MRGTGFNNRLKWTIYSPASQTTHHGHFNTSVVPLSEGLDSGFGLTFTPFRSPTAAEIAYCKGLSHWWEGVVKSREEAQKEVTVIGNYGGENHQRPSQRWSRVHRLISDAHPDAPPSGYFDCTVEVSLQGTIYQRGGLTRCRSCTACSTMAAPGFTVCLSPTTLRTRPCILYKPIGLHRI